MNGKNHGIEKEYYESGALSQETSYVNGKIHGIRKNYYESGALRRETPFKNGVKHGLVKCYDKEKSNRCQLTLYERSHEVLTLWCES